jgi:site-specific DNA-methyltransferase (adenine-specific)
METATAILERRGTSVDPSPTIDRNLNPVKSASATVETRSVTIGAVAARVVLSDAISAMQALPDDSFDLAIIDPPYGASTAATWALPENHGLSGFGGKWSLASHEWDMMSGLDSFSMTVAYLTEIKRLVKPTGSFFVHSTYHNSGIVNVVCQLLGIEILNEIIWYKRNAFPNLANRRLTASHETIHWAHTGTSKSRKYRFNADAVKASGKQMRTVWDVPNNKNKTELEYGKHPTQKPISIVSRLLLMAGTPEGQLLVPFAGSGTELVAGLRYEMNCLGYEINREYFSLAARRLEAEQRNREGRLEL